MERFSVEATGTGRRVVLAVTGEADLAAATRFGEELARHIVADGTLVVDCSGITFIDSMGLRTLIEAMQKAARAGTSFRLAAVPDPVARVLDLAGVTGLFAIHEDPAEALAD